MDIPTLTNSHVMPGIVFFIMIVPFILIRLGSVLTATISPDPGRAQVYTRSVFVGSALCTMMIFSPFMAASAQEVFVIFPESGPEVYQVEAVQEPSLTSSTFNSPWWTHSTPNLKMDRFLMNTFSVKDNSVWLLPGFQTMAAASGLTTKIGRIDWRLSQDQTEWGKRVTMPPNQITTPVLTQFHPAVQQNNLVSFHARSH